MEVVLSGPLLNRLCVDILDQDVDMFQRSDTLESDPVLEPHYPSLTPGAELVDEETVDKIPNETSAFFGDIARIWVCWNEGPRPHYNMCDVGGETIWPVVLQDPVVRGFCKWDFRDGSEGERTPGFGQSILQEVVGHVAIGSLCLSCPFHVSAQV